jgi:hypothetical protein
MPKSAHYELACTAGGIELTSQKKTEDRNGTKQATRAVFQPRSSPTYPGSVPETLMARTFSANTIESRLAKSIADLGHEGAARIA